jgi:hypothetical protein
MHHWTVTLFIVIVTLYALFADDIKIAAFERKNDEAFNYITSVVFGVFILEIIINSIVQKHYFLGFYFWLDIFATVSLITDITWIWYAIVGDENVDFIDDPMQRLQF